MIKMLIKNLSNIIFEVNQMIFIIEIYCFNRRDRREISYSGLPQSDNANLASKLNFLLITKIIFYYKEFVNTSGLNIVFVLKLFYCQAHRYIYFNTKL